MSKKTIKVIEEVEVAHPLEEVLEIKEGSTTEIVEYRQSELVDYDDYDEKDNEIERDLQQIVDCALDVFESTCEEANSIEGRYRARNMEVAAQFLNIALNAVKEKETMKINKDRNKARANKGPSTVNQNLIVADRNDILKKLFEDGGDE